jgi:phage gp29-like protein
MVTLYDQFGREVAPAKRPERRPLAAAPIYDAWREYVAAGLTPEVLASLLREADAGDVRRQCELFDQIEEKDGHILGEKSKRQNTILDFNFEVQPADEDARSKTVSEFVDDYISNTTDWDDVLVSLQDAVGKGYAGLEIRWDVSEGDALPSALEFVEQKRFVFVDDKGLLRPTPKLITDDAPMGIEIPAWKMLFHRYGGKSGSATRSGIYRVCAWMYLFKNYALKDWVIFAEVFGMPLRLGKYPAGATDADKTALVNAISSLGTDAAGVISKDTEIEFVDKVQRTASADLYKMLAEFCNKENSKAILGQTLTADVGDKGSFAAAKTHNEVRLDLLKADARAIAATVRYQLIRPIVGFNFGWDTPVPKFEAVFPEEHEISEYHYKYGLLLKNEGRKAIGLPPIDGWDVPVVDAELAAQGMAAKMAAGERMGLQTGDRGKPHILVAAKAENGQDLAPARFTPDQQAIEELIDEIMPAAAVARDRITADILAAVEQAESWEDMQILLAEMLGDQASDEQLAEILTRAITGANMWGRYAAS